MEVPGSIFCDRDSDISIYLMLITKVVRVISMYVPPDMIKLVPANCPELVRFVMEIKTASQTGSPALTAINPNVKETGRYPRPTGSPFISPFLYCCFFVPFIVPILC